MTSLNLYHLEPTNIKPTNIKPIDLKATNLKPNNRRTHFFFGQVPEPLDPILDSDMSLLYAKGVNTANTAITCLLYTSPSPRD